MNFRKKVLSKKIMLAELYKELSKLTDFDKELGKAITEPEPNFFPPRFDAKDVGDKWWEKYK